jgi:hypothetical protein
MDAELLEAAEAHVRIIVKFLGLQIMPADARASLGELARDVASIVKRVSELPAPTGDVTDIAPSGMALFSLIKGYERGLEAVLEAVKRHVPELAPLVECFAG